MRRLSDAELIADLESNPSPVVMYYAEAGAPTDAAAASYQRDYPHGRFGEPARLLAVDLGRAPGALEGVSAPLGGSVVLPALMLTSPQQAPPLRPREPRAFREGHFTRAQLDTFAGVHYAPQPPRPLPPPAAQFPPGTSPSKPGEMPLAVVALAALWWLW